MASRKTDKELLHYLSKEFGITLEEAEEIYYYQFKFVEDTIKKGLFYGVRVRYLGKFVPLLNKVTKINNSKHGIAKKKSRDGSN